MTTAATKTCTSCGTEKPIGDFQKLDYGYRGMCKVCRTTQAMEYKLKIRYGISIAERDQMLVDQGGVCKICKSPDPQHAKGWALDHCHSQGHIRGILCQPCNLALGAMERLHRLGVLRVAMEYAGVVI